MVLLCLAMTGTAAAKARVMKVSSPQGEVNIEVKVGEQLSYSLMDGSDILLEDNVIALDIEGGSQRLRVASTHRERRQEHIVAPFYRQAAFDVAYESLYIDLGNGTGVEFRAYDDGMAYRFCTTGYADRDYIVRDEQVEFNVFKPDVAYLPYSTNRQKPQAMAFQAVYSAGPLPEQPGGQLAFLPATVGCGRQGEVEGVKLTFMESDLEDYPGLFVRADGRSLKGWLARRPKSFDYYPWRMQKYVTETEDHIARCHGNRTFPWRVVAVSNADAEMPVNNLVYALASPNRVGDTSWIRPGLVAWDWWNDWGLSRVDFKAGINMPTYRYYIDFAAKYGLPYIILDEGWYDPKGGDMLTPIADIDLPALVQYGREKGVRLILWTVFNVLDNQLEAACRKYADMGIAGFKVDFLDRDDQEGVGMVYRIAEACARHHLMLDCHGIYKPTGINRTYPNIVNFESVFGMEEAKWTKHDEQDMPLYDVTFPFIRQQTGFVDFTPGGMRNASRKDFQPVYYNPMTMGTRCHQLAMYIVHDSPLTMLADSPTAYEREPEYTRFLASLPTVFDETRVLQGWLGHYIVTARRKGNTWYVGGQTNWTARDVVLPLDFLPAGKEYQATIYRDGINADKAATDYEVGGGRVTNTSTLDIHLAEGGGFVLKLER